MITLKQLKQMVDKAVELKGEDAEVFITVYETICIFNSQPNSLDIDPNTLEDSSPELLSALNP